jgi:hypothetical protein
VKACEACQNREAKRVARKIAARVRPSRSDVDEEVAPTPRSVLSVHSQQADETGIVQFNCTDVLDFAGGSASLPVRITCYCRHHHEKIGFR